MGLCQNALRWPLEATHPTGFLPPQRFANPATLQPHQEEVIVYPVAPRAGGVD